MSNKRTLTIFILIILLVGLCGILPASAAPKATTYTVNSDTDAQDANPGDGVCATAGGECTLRAAIEEANTHTGYQTIHFASMFQQPHDIEGCLPPITTDNLTIDASNWWDTAYNRPGVEITGSSGGYPRVPGTFTVMLALGHIMLALGHIMLASDHVMLASNRVVLASNRVVLASDHSPTLRGRGLGLSV